MQGRNQCWLRCALIFAQSQPPKPLISSLLVTNEKTTSAVTSPVLLHIGNEKFWKLWSGQLGWYGLPICRWPVWMTGKCHSGVFVNFLLLDVVNNVCTYTNIHTHTQSSQSKGNYCYCKDKLKNEEMLECMLLEKFHSHSLHVNNMFSNK